MQRRHHYEQALEHYLRVNRVPYVAVDEARKALLPSSQPTAAAPAIKSFDLVVYGEEANLLVEVKGRRIGPSGSRRLECWVTRDDVESLTAWEQMFGDGFRAAFLFIFWCEEQPAAPLFEDIFEFHSRWYAARLVLLRDYASAMRDRSPRWRTVHLSAADFDRLSRPFSASASPLHARPAPSLQPSATPVASPS